MAQQTIQCPTQTLDTDVTTKLPGEWWSTSQRGRLTDTEVVRINGAPKLMCVYKMSSSEVSIMRDAPAGMTCRAAGNGFRCDGSGSPANRKLETDGQASAQPNVVKDPGKVLTPGNIGRTQPVETVSKGACPDPTLTGVEVRMLSRDPQGQYFFRLAARVENRGRGAYTSADGQQVVRIEEISPGSKARQIAVGAFRNIPAGGRGAEITHDVLRWRISQEFPPSYRFTIAYDPDISADGNPANDDCELRNNSTTITGEEINAIIRGSGI